MTFQFEIDSRSPHMVRVSVDAEEESINPLYALFNFPSKGNF